MLSVAAKPDPNKIPLVVRCDTTEEQAEVFRGTEPFCLEGTFHFLVPVRENYNGWYFWVDIMNSSFEYTEICDGDGFLGERWWLAYAHHPNYPNFHPIEYVPEHCEPGTFFWEIRWEERDDDGNVLDWETHIRRWVIPEE